MKFGFNFGLLGKGGGGAYATNACFSPVGNSGTLYGTVGVYTLTPALNVYGQPIKLTVDTSNNDVIIKFGAGGDEPLPEPGDIFIMEGSINVGLTWNVTHKYYIGNSPEITTAISSATDICVGIYEYPNLLIHYTFSEVER